jgi:hypothetical protein
LNLQLVQHKRPSAIHQHCRPWHDRQEKSCGQLSTPHQAGGAREVLEQGHSHLRVSALAKRYGWGIHNNAEGKVALIAVDSPEYKRLMKDPLTTKVKAFRSTRT